MQHLCYKLGHTFWERVTWESQGKSKKQKKREKQLKELYQQQQDELDKMLSEGYSKKDMNSKIYKLKQLITGPKIQSTELSFSTPCARPATSTTRSWWLSWTRRTESCSPCTTRTQTSSICAERSVNVECQSMRLQSISDDMTQY